MKIIHILPLFFCTLSFTAHSQYGSMVNYTTKDGLPSSQVYDIIQDDFGYLWFSTDKGLSRYNGYEFKNYDKSDGLTDNVVFDFLKRPNGDIWCTTNASTIFKFSGVEPIFTPYQYNDTLLKYAIHRITNSIYFSQKNELYLGLQYRMGYLKLSPSGEVIQLQHDHVESEIPCQEVQLAVLKDDRSEPFFFYSFDGFKSQNPIGRKFVPIINRSDDRMCVGKGEALYFEKSNTGVFIVEGAIHIQREDQEYTIPIAKEAIASGKLNDREFWVGYRYGGVCVYTLTGELVDHLLPERSVTQIFIDHEENTWVSTLEKGVFKLSNRLVYSVPTINGIHITSVVKGPNNGILLGCYNGKVFSRLSKLDFELMYDSGLSQEPVKIVFDEKKQRNYFSVGTILSKDRVYAENFDSDYLSVIDNRYLAYGIRGLFLYDLETDKNVDFILFFGTRIKDVSYFNNKLYGGGLNGLHVASLDHPEKEKALLEGTRIDDLNILGNYLVLSTNGNGVKLLNKKNLVKYSIGVQEGLSSNYVSKTFSENDSTLWVCTNMGINRITFRDKGKSFTIDQMNINDGLLSNEVWDLHIERDTIWVGTQNGLNYFSMQHFNKIQTTKYHYYLQWESIHVNDNVVGARTSFAHDENKMEFNVLGISFGAEKALEYRYLLKGLEDQWNYTTARMIGFSALMPGNYELVVQVKGKENDWRGNEIRYSFTIRPPFWKTWWFILICIVFIGAVIYLFFRIRVLTYNKDVVHEILRLVLRKLKKEEPFVIIRQNGKDVKLKTSEIHFIKTSGNYLEIFVEKKNYLIRSSISKFLESVPDKIEFLQVHRSYIVRIEHVQQKGKNELIVLNHVIPVGKIYTENIKMIHL